jgi:ATP-dependent Lhr-like helicase
LLNVEWCERHLLQRIHRRTLQALRKEVEPVSPEMFLRWLLGWQHLTPATQLSGEAGVLLAIAGLAGFEAPAIAWETELLPARVANFDPRWLDALCLSGRIGWGRLSAHPALTEERAMSAAPRAIVPTSVAPITFFLRDACDWMRLAQPDSGERERPECLSPQARATLEIVRSRGACFLPEIQRAAQLTKGECERALWELAAAGLATADGFDNLRMLIDPRRRATAQVPRELASAMGGSARKTHAVGRWCLLHGSDAEALTAGERDDAIASTCCTLLRRYGVVFRELMEREQFAVRWRDLLAMLRRMEARGEVRGGRFVTGVSGEQYALPEAMASLREFRNHARPLEKIEVAAADPLNLAGILLPGERVSAMAGKRWSYEPSGKVSAQESVATTNQLAEYSLVGGISGGGISPGGGVGGGAGGYINAASGG